MVCGVCILKHNLSTLVYWFACIFGIDANSRVSSGGGGGGGFDPPHS